jgi:hypothetical protein
VRELGHYADGMIAECDIAAMATVRRVESVLLYSVVLCEDCCLCVLMSDRTFYLLVGQPPNEVAVIAVRSIKRRRVVATWWN